LSSKRDQKRIKIFNKKTKIRFIIAKMCFLSFINPKSVLFLEEKSTNSEKKYHIFVLKKFLALATPNF
jgi:hypothetical protein